MNIKRLLSGLLALITVLSVFAFPVSAEETTQDGANASSTIESGNVYNELQDYDKLSFKTPEDKIKTMNLMDQNDKFELYVEPWTGEVYCRNKQTGEVLSTNPTFDSFAEDSSKPVTSKRYELLSQIIIKYSDTTGTTKTYTSYEHAALNNQILVKNIKGGVRIEYTIGRSEASYLVPRLIEKNRAEDLIFSKLPGFDVYKESGYSDGSAMPLKAKNVVYQYTLYDPNNEENPKSVLETMQQNYPVTKNGMAVYALSSDIKSTELARAERYIKEFAPDYTYDDLDYDHQLTNYVGATVEPALFKLSLEYHLTDTGMSVRLPANGIRYDSANYTLQDMQILPFIGAGANTNTGYNFLPDGTSGALTRFEDYVGKSVNLSGRIYGEDYAYNTLKGDFSVTMRFPIFGVVEDIKKTRMEEYEVSVDKIDPETGETVTVTETRVRSVPYTQSKGFLAVIEEGDALVSVMSTSGSSTHKYYSVITSFDPRPKDSYTLADSISVGSKSAITVLSKRKYVGNLKMNFIMLSDEGLAEEAGVEKYYDASWVGMAHAYRDYLISNGSLTKLTAENTEEDMPLYLETFGVLQTIEKILSIPVETDVALTSFENIKTMYNELSEKGITNINFKLTGYTNGGMWSTVPYKLEWEKAVGGEEGLEDLVAYSKEKGFGIFPDFDFMYLSSIGTGDGITFDKHLVKTINDQYVYKSVYNAAEQMYEGVGLVISPNTYAYLFEGFNKRYAKAGIDAISVSTLSSDLNSDFDEEEPYNREDAKKLVQDVYADIKENYSEVMSESGNAYTLKYVDHLLKVTLESNRYNVTSTSVPFAGVVLHGYKNFTGTAINNEGDVDYAVLKAIENGASLYFILSYDNVELLKEDIILQKNFSVRYDIWFDELVEQYNKLNDAIGDLQTEVITDHEFLVGERTPDADEVEADKAAAEAKADAIYAELLATAEKNALAAMREQFKNGEIEAGKEVVLLEEVVRPEPVIVVGGPDADGKYVKTKYTIDDESIVKVTYGDKVSFIINYNDFEVTIFENGEAVTLEPFSFKRIG